MKKLNINGMKVFTVESHADAVELSETYKALNRKDDDVSHYSKSKKEFMEKVAAAKANAKAYTDENIPDVILYNRNKLVTICLTKDDYHGKDWHLSMAQPTASGLPAPIDDETSTFFLNSFFSQWEEIENPGAIKEIRHFVGND